MAKTRRRQAKPALCRIRAEHRTGILSDSFAGAREREQAACGFEGLVDEIVYSHEVGMSKPDPNPLNAPAAPEIASSVARWPVPGRFHAHND